MACVLGFPFVLAALCYPLRNGGFASKVRRFAVLAIAAILISAPLYITIAGLGNNSGGDRSYDVSNHDRLVAWQASLDAFNENPLTGVGVGVDVELTGASEDRLSYSHNVLLTWLKDSGLPAGVLAFATILLLARGAAVALESASRSQSDYVMTVSSALSLFAVIGFSAIDGALQGNYIFYFLPPLLYAFIAGKADKRRWPQSESRR